MRYVLKHATSSGNNIFQLFDTSEKPNHFVASKRRQLESQGRDDARQDSGRNECHDIEYQGTKAKAPPCPNSTLQTPLPQQSSSSAREEEDHWELRKTGEGEGLLSRTWPRRTPRYLDNCNVKVGITELQERVVCAVAIRSLHSASGTASAGRRCQTIFSKNPGTKEDNYVLHAGPGGRRSGKA